MFTVFQLPVRMLHNVELYEGTDTIPGVLVQLMQSDAVCVMNMIARLCFLLHVHMIFWMDKMQCNVIMFI